MSEKMSEEAKIAAEREKNAHPSAILRGAVWLLARFPWTKHRYQNWTAGRRILIGYLLWLVCLPIIPIAGIIIWYLHDPEGFRKSPWAKALIALAVVWAGAFGLIATEPAQIDSNGKYSAIQTTPDGETGGSTAEKPATAVTDSAKQKVAKQSSPSPAAGRTFENCTAAFEAGVYNIKRSDPAYDTKLDRDNDGIACER